MKTGESLHYTGIDDILWPLQRILHTGKRIWIPRIIFVAAVISPESWSRISHESALPYSGTDSCSKQIPGPTVSPLSRPTRQQQGGFMTFSAISLIMTVFFSKGNAFMVCFSNCSEKEQKKSSTTLTMPLCTIIQRLHHPIPLHAREGSRR
jgi:hypothetical protein